MKLSTLTKDKIPTRKDEDWHYSRFFSHPAFKENTFIPPQSPFPPSTKALLNDSFKLFIFNGAIDETKGDFRALKPYIKAPGIFHFPSGTKFDRPIEFCFAQNGLASFAETDLSIKLGPDSAITLIESYKHTCQTPQTIESRQLQIELGNGASLEHYCYQNLPLTNQLYTETLIYLSEKAHYDRTNLILGSAYHRDEIKTLLNEPKSNLTLRTIFALHGKSCFDLLTKIKHHSPDCTSSQEFRGALSESASAHIQGGISVAQHAQKTIASQNTKTLLLSEKSLANTKPELEIFADDVECRHGATTGHLNEEELFYLEARGIPHEQARQMLIEAFLTSPLNGIKNDRIRERLLQKIRQKNEL